MNPDSCQPREWVMLWKPRNMTQRLPEFTLKNIYIIQSLLSQGGKKKETG